MVFTIDLKLLGGFVSNIFLFSRFADLLSVSLFCYSLIVFNATGFSMYQFSRNS